MKAMILAAGIGSRLQPLTEETPKALIPVGGVPMLEHIILKIKAAGFDYIVINIHHLSEQIIDFLSSKKNFGVTIEFSDERDYLLETGGGIKQASRLLSGNEPFLVHNVDMFTDVDLTAMYNSHINSNALATLLVSNRRSSRQLLFNGEGRLCGWRNRQTGEVKSHFPQFDPSKYLEYAFGGVHVISPEIFRLMEEWTGRFSIINFYLSICPKHQIRFYTEDNIQLIDAGKPRGLEEAERWLSTIKQ
ncbi:MAG: nucleotidyltransferase family protein [Tannerella sp.]|jgi:NDP-sugar pyrophosphorylase family protein|nr:nucleotidyltransferase family protein [Tannerella sp.]